MAIRWFTGTAGSFAGRAPGRPIRPWRLVLTRRDADPPPQIKQELADSGISRPTPRAGSQAGAGWDNGGRPERSAAPACHTMRVMSTTKIRDTLEVNHLGEATTNAARELRLSGRLSAVLNQRLCRER